MAISGSTSLQLQCAIGIYAELAWTSFWDSAERPNGQISKAWNISAWPTIYVLDADGVIRYVGHGNDRKLDTLVNVLVEKLGKK